jgi:hypothetical protein
LIWGLSSWPLVSHTSDATWTMSDGSEFRLAYKLMVSSQWLLFKATQVHDRGEDMRHLLGPHIDKVSQSLTFDAISIWF